MRKFIVNVNGNQYEVEVQEVASGVAPVYAAPVVAPVAPVVAAPAPVAASAPVAAPAPVAAAGNGKPVAAPMPGTIVDLKVGIGDAVKQGQVLAILEAMKMENEIMCDTDGTVTSVEVSKGSSVNSGDVLIRIG